MEKKKGDAQSLLPLQSHTQRVPVAHLFILFSGAYSHTHKLFAFAELLCNQMLIFLIPQ